MVPVQVVVNGATAGTAVQSAFCTPAVVGRNIRGVPPGAVFAGPVAVTRNVPELVLVQVPDAAPLMVQL